MWNVRDDEPEYAFIPATEAPEKNQYGKNINLVEQNDSLANQSLNINNDADIGKNPDRYKQHGFYFNADNCISCHACESACSEKNNLSPHLAFRSVGYVEGGSYPDYHRLNISMACNHCDDPVCLKGCPTRAYTKFAEYGAVLQDPDICFGCGYCTWVCPYNAPQLDPVKGEVEKCNMCVDRLEVGLKPACASACLAGALDFGVIETKPENRDQLNTSIPGFPDPEITRPNIRFQQTRTLPAEMLRTDSVPIRYTKDRDTGKYRSRVKKDPNVKIEWNLKKLSSREDPLVLFTLLSQLAIGGFLFQFLAPAFGLSMINIGLMPVSLPLLLLTLCAMLAFGLLMSTVHLGKPMRFYRGFNNLRYSPVSREAASLMVFFGLMGCYTLLSFLPLLTQVPMLRLEKVMSVLGWLASGFGLITLYFMHRIYRIKARPFWNHWQVLTAFYGTMLSLGGLFSGALIGTVLLFSGQLSKGVMQFAAMTVFIGLLLEAIGLFFHAHDMKRQEAEGGASHYQQTTFFGKTYWLRNGLLFLSLLVSAALVLNLWSGVMYLLAWAVLGFSVLISAMIGRALFYVLVIPTTMPGAFFWRNKGFQEHAIETGLADMQQVGIVADRH